MRLDILAYLKKHREATVGNIAEVINLSFKATSKHLAILSAADIVKKDQRGLQMYYRLLNNQSEDVQKVITLI
jgi:DNA-binding transcriptional ArsR family regulator